MTAVSRALLGGALACVAMLIAAPAAMADHAFDRFIGGSGSGALEAQFDGPNGPAIDPDTGQLYVADLLNERVQRFSAEGEFELTWGRGVRTGGGSAETCTAAQVPCQGSRTGSADGEFDGPQSVAVSPFNGDIYVVERSNGRVQQFSLEDNGTPGDPSDDLPLLVRTFGSLGGVSVVNGAGIAVSPVDGDVFISEVGTARRVQRFNANGTLDANPVIGEAGTGAEQFGNNAPMSVAVDSQGILYVGNTNGSGRIERYDTAGIHGTQGFLDPIPASASFPAATGSSGTNGLAVDYDSDGAGPDVDRLFVVRDPNSGSTAIYEFSAPGEVALPAAPVAHLSAFFGTTAGVSAARGLAYSASSDRLYAATLDNFMGSAIGDGVLAFDADGTTPAVEATADSPSSVGVDEADVSGFVDPHDGLARFRFEYSSTGVEPWTALPWQTVAGSGPQSVSRTLTGLEPNTNYRMRIVAEKVLGHNDVIQDISTERTFLTDTAPPEATTRPVHSFTDGSAWLAGVVDPNSHSTSYRFEWGPTSSYTEQLPLSDASAGAGATPRTFLHQIDGLEPNTTYHYRIVAEGDHGSDAGVDKTFKTRPPFDGFAGRGYEQVSPPDKNDARLESFGLDVLPVAASGDAAVLSSLGPFADAPFIHSAAQGRLYYRAKRNAAGDGWTTKVTSPKGCSFDTGLGASQIRHFFGSMEDSKVALVGCLVDSERETVAGGFLRDTTVGDMSNASADDLTKLFDADGTGTAGIENVVVGASADFSHVVFESTESKTADAGVPPGGWKVYEWVDGEVRLASVAPGGTPFATEAVAGRGVTTGNRHIKRSTVSDDGQHVFFTTPVGGSAIPDTAQIYRRSGGASTLLVSPSKADTPDPQGPKGKEFAWATPDGDEVFFLSAEQLTDDANTGPARDGTDLYRYEASTDTLIDISAESNDVNGARVRGLLGASRDGDWAYYVAQGQVVAGEGTPGADNVYLWRDDGTADGETRFIATLAPGDDGNLGAFAARTENKSTARVSDDGRTLLLQSTARLTGYRSHGTSQVYVYEADANGGEGALSCVSCRPNGSPALGDATVPTTAPESGDALARVLSAGGSRVFFQSEDDLLPADANGRQDVYVWEAGRLALISTGASEHDSAFQGASRSGGDVFFMTRERLVGQDRDHVVDVYDARVGGGIPEQGPPVRGVPCVGADCKPAPSPPPSEVPGSTGFEGKGDVEPTTELPDCATLDRRAAVLMRKSRRLARRAGRANVKRAQRRLERRASRLRARGRRVQRRAAITCGDCDRLTDRARTLRKRTRRLTLRAVRGDRRVVDRRLRRKAISVRKRAKAARRLAVMCRRERRDNQ